MPLGVTRAALKTHALQTLARSLQTQGSREAFGVRASSAPLFLLIVAALSFPFTYSSQAEDQTLPTIRSMIGGLLFDGEHLYVAESQVGIPLYYQDQYSFFYRQ